MPAIETALDPRSPQFRANADAHGRRWSPNCASRWTASAKAAAQAARERHLARGKLLPRDRVRALIDPASPFLELGQLAAHGMYGGEVPAAGRHHRHRPRDRGASA